MLGFMMQDQNRAMYSLASDVCPAAWVSALRLLLATRGSLNDLQSTTW